MPKSQPLFEEAFPPHDFVAWQKNNRLTNAQVARLFEVRPQTVGRWRAVGAPMLVRFACMGWSNGYRPPHADLALYPPRRSRSDKPAGNPNFKRKAP